MAIVALAFVVAFIPAFAWLVFVYRLDRFEPEPKSLIARLFLWGLAAGPWASGMNILIAHVFSPGVETAQRDGNFLLAAFLLLALVALSALNEEVMKYTVVSSRVRGDPAFNEPVDGMIYMSAAAIGFSFGENVVYIANAYFGLVGDATRPGVTLAVINAFLVTAPLRAFGSTIGHISWSGITGWFGALSIDPDGSFARRGNRHSIREAGIFHVLKEVGEHYARLSRGPEQTLGERKAAEANVQDQPSYCFSFDERDSRTEVCMHQTLALPTRVQTFEGTDLVESYTWADYHSNVGLTDRDFDVGNPAYGF